MPESPPCGISAALGLTCKAFFPGCPPEAVPGPAAGAPGVVAEASPEVGPPPCCHPHPHHSPALAQEPQVRAKANPSPQLLPLKLDWNSSCPGEGCRSLLTMALAGAGRAAQGSSPQRGPSTEHSPGKAWLPPPVNTAVPPTGRINKELCTSAFPTPASTVCTQHFVVGWACSALGFFDSF